MYALQYLFGEQAFTNIIVDVLQLALDIVTAHPAHIIDRDV